MAWGYEMAASAFQHGKKWTWLMTLGMLGTLTSTPPPPNASFLPNSGTSTLKWCFLKQTLEQNRTWKHYIGKGESTEMGQLEHIHLEAPKKAFQFGSQSR